MSENTLEFAPMPPLIVALDTSRVETAIDTVESLTSSHFGCSSRIGFKIARWHDQNLELRELCQKTGLFTVLDTQLDDGIEEMSIATRSLLSVSSSAGKLILPQAITMSRPKETVRGQKDKVQSRIFNFAHEQDDPVMVISHIDQTRMAPSDPNLQETDSVDSFSEARVKFDAIELHADTVLSDHFKRECENAKREGREIPFFLASRITYGQAPNDDDAIAARAAHAYRLGVRSIYLGARIMNAEKPEIIIEKILNSYDDAHTIEDEEEFNNIYQLKRRGAPSLSV